MIENITGKSYADNLQKRITSKLKLTDTYVGSKVDPMNHEAYSYTFMGGWNQYPETDMSIPGGAGAIVSTPSDLVKFINGLFSGKLLGDDSLIQMKTLKEGYGMGMFQIPFYDRYGYGHNGSIDAFTASLGYFPEDNITIAYCTNGQVYPMNEIIVGALSVVFNHAYVIPSFETISLRPEELDYYLGVYASSAFPLKLTITRKDSTLFAQATGQMQIPLEATAIDKFKFDPAGINIVFNRDKNELTLKQGGGHYIFTKE
jgi:CubicO group peptidase (beta-lactamase class C family)